MALKLTVNSFTGAIKYPLENTDEYKGWITFQPLYESPPTINTNGAAVDTEGSFFLHWHLRHRRDRP